MTYKLLTLINILPFALPTKVPLILNSIKGLEVFKEYEPYFIYFESTWINGSYSIELWNVISKLKAYPELITSLRHSNNLIESFHSLLNFTLLKSPQPTMNEFLEGLKYIEGRTLNNLLNYDNKPLIAVVLILSND